jgi:hypothetical protein
MGLKAIGYGLWVNLIQRAEPHRVVLQQQHGAHLLPGLHRRVALQVAFEIGYGFERL